jgi:hypothetical protein
VTLLSCMLVLLPFHTIHTFHTMVSAAGQRLTEPQCEAPPINIDPTVGPGKHVKQRFLRSRSSTGPPQARGAWCARCYQQQGLHMA